ncbi:MAG TPA: hypothetical protein DCE71_06705 [Parachlamydiales bacterium]|nr:hypothetical protein [Parachlamydiales bacterium]
MSCPLKAASSNQIAWIGNEGSLSYREINELADRWVFTLIGRGVKEGSRVAFSPHLNPLIIALFFAIWRLGASACPLHLRLPLEQRKKMVQRLRPDILILEDERPDLLRSSFSRVCPALPAVFLMTSGSTAEPKIAVLSYQNIWTNAETAISFLDLRAGDRWLLNLPLFHVGGIGVVMRCVLAQAAMVAALQEPHITHMSCVPTQLYRATPVYKTLRCVLLGGAPVHSYPERLPVIVTYGLTEMGSMVLAQRHPTNGYLGFALSKREIKLADDGEILVRGECLFQGYWHDGNIEPPESWFATKDRGHFDPVQGFQILGRKDWQFISGGENIQPEEIERYLLEIPGVQEAVVVPKQDPEFGARPVAFVSGNLSLERMKKCLLPYLPKYKIPIALISIDEMPKNGLKVDRLALFNRIR